jgi:hypothetical protein
MLPCHRPQNDGATQSWSVTSRTMNQNKTFFFIRYLSQAFYYSVRKLTDRLCIRKKKVQEGEKRSSIGSSLKYKWRRQVWEPHSEEQMHSVEEVLLPLEA